MPDRNQHVKPLVGVSACLLGEKVRYDGGHKRDGFISGPLAEEMRYVTVCPETAIGLGVPRPTIRLVGPFSRPRALGVKDPTIDVTKRLELFSEKQVGSYGELNGFILKKDSPSCGMTRVKVYPGEIGGSAERKGSGIFARILMAHYPNLPVEEEGRLNDPVLRENFINRVYVHQRWQQLMQSGLSAAGLIDFHSRHKYLLMTHSQAAYKRLGKLLSDLSGSRPEEIAGEYINEVMTTLKHRVSRKRHVNVLQHIMGYLKRSIEADDKAELADCIERYRREEIPLVVPITLLRHYFRRHPDPYMTQQIYLQPHPENLGLRNAL
ncbi:YbgA family protein [Solemya velesiana gill symbiont]|uniref:DUF1722 domain-containing protein n=1 Tax=Solemya velesiana gill symbiont TaxID=1918948 RepID=A0A1T2KV44_9GAMM|nr:DUF523 and DUF1722 domain-containing protein [Solemya velesiana gill symbiont]OOZ36715.1 hypothetical protein BOW51_05775 [Solemya velesiana gill symbiont]